MPTEAPSPSVRPLAAGGLIHVIVDTPRDSRNKYKYDEASRLFALSRILPDGLHFPCDFGFIPGTMGEDGDPLDVALLCETALTVGCLLTVRLLGLIKAEQIEDRKSIRNDRFLGVPVTPVNKPSLKDISDVDKATLLGLEQFFVMYNKLQGRTFRPLGRAGAAAAGRALRRSLGTCRSRQRA